MVCTYDETLTAEKDQLRYAIGDRDTDVCALSDAEIAYELSQAGSVGAARLPAARSALRNLARMALDVVDGPFSLKASQLISNLKEIIADIETASATSATAAPFLGGVSRADVRSREDDTDRVPPYFRRDDEDTVTRQPSRYWP